MEQKKSKFIYHQSQIDTMRQQMNARADAQRLDEIFTAITPIFAVSLTTKANEKEHFANFYGTTIPEPKDLDKAAIEAKLLQNESKILGMVTELEQKIKNGDFDKVQGNLAVEVGWTRFGGQVYEAREKMADPLYCASVEQALALFIRQYAKVGKTPEQILNEQFNPAPKRLIADDLEI